MIITFEKEYLRDLYETGKTTDKKYRFQPDVLKRYKKCIKTLEMAGRVEDLFVISSLNDEVLKGHKYGISSIQVNNQYRIDFLYKRVSVF